MKDLKSFIADVHAKNKITQDMDRKEIIDCLDVIANDITNGRATLLHANTILSIRYALMNSSERDTEYAELSSAAATLGRVKSPKKAASSRENGKKGGRPRNGGE